jgi:hypothetical protein
MVLDQWGKQTSYSPSKENLFLKKIKKKPWQKICRPIMDFLGAHGVTNVQPIS